MRDLKTFFKDIITKPPVVFPLVALFHVVLLLWTVYSLVQQPGTSTEISVLWMLAYTTLWLATADMRKWGAMGYVVVTVVGIVIFLNAKQQYTWIQYETPMFISDMLFCFFIMFYFKRFR
ncbi:hypothetical protein CJD36_013360 [Flavipsychrobacter stenotrophus]|uniref:Uncharacterized protein n=1 Tax=Flavipsychrobacter stenotrophus TaxID=2077091 RepID=A0A2S7SVM4_9BACT|nr:hypothetical protein [Flavipsychrobacter stenotrophus]PQJ10953.1 hypothetical protein CJD36_013360 [Flavipsychrobacter stenotrophus]